MKSLAFYLTIIFLLIQNFALALAPTTLLPDSSMTLEEELVVLPAGTIVSLSLNEEVKYQEVSVGNALDFFVRSNVIVNGKVLIATGTIAEGWVKKIAVGCGGRCAKVTISVENVQTTDGQRIYLRSIPHSASLSCCGYYNLPEEITIGTKISARVLNDVEVTL